MIGIASSSASAASLAVRRGPPMPGDRVPEAAGAEPELEPPAAHDVERGRGLGDHRRPAERQVRHVGEEAQPRRPGQQVGDQRERVEEPPLVRVVLDADEVEPAALGREDLLDEVSG